MLWLHTQRLFLPKFLIVIKINKFSSNGQLFMSNQLWMFKFNMGFHRNDPIKLIVFDKTFLYSRSLDRSRASSCSILQMMHRNICGFSTSIGKLLIAKKPQQIEVWLCGFQGVAWAHIKASCYISTLIEFEIVAIELSST
jgi:hypothetical protein